MSRPSPLLRALFAAPAVLFRAGLGWMLGRRFLALTHRGRRSAALHVTVLEVVSFDPDTEESVVASAYGSSADWYRNLQVEPAIRVRTGRMDHTPEQRFLGADEARKVAVEFCRRHPWEAKLVTRILPAIGAAVPGGSASAVDMLASLPMVAFRPRR